MQVCILGFPKVPPRFQTQVLVNGPYVWGKGAKSGKNKSVFSCFIYFSFSESCGKLKKSGGHMQVPSVPIGEAPPGGMVQSPPCQSGSLPGPSPRLDAPPILSTSEPGIAQLCKSHLPQEVSSDHSSQFNHKRAKNRNKILSTFKLLPAGGDSHVIKHCIMIGEGR